MHYLSVEEVSKQYGDVTLFSQISFGLSKGDKMALVAKNGAGKSTLLRILASKEEADTGLVTLKSGVSLVLLSQDPDFDGNKTVEEVIKSNQTQLLSTIQAYHQAVEDHSNNPSNEAILRLETLTNQMDIAQAWDYERRLEVMLDRFNIFNKTQLISTLSGGQKKRLSLAIALLDDPDLLLLDEPTNHLDIEMIEWLEKYLSQSHITFIMVTHDRYFLDRVCNHIIELDRSNLYNYTGNYSQFLHQKSEREEIAKTEVDKAKKLMKKELDWIQRMPKARTTKSKARIDSFEKTKEKAHSHIIENELKLNVNSSRIGGKILEMNKVTKSYDDQLLVNNFSYLFKKGERIGILGKNGIGKSTFLNLITEKISPDRGNISSGDTIVYGYYCQDGIKIKENQRVIDVVTDIAEVIPLGKNGSITASQFLHYFLFNAEMQNQLVSSLSGGEKRRLYLLTVLVTNPNFLILDEPTNDLDLLTLNKLEEFLVNFKGCLILVSHDRYFLDKTIDHMFVFEGNGLIKDFPGNYTQYRQWNDERERNEKLALREEKKKTDAPVKQKIKTKLSYAERKEYECLEKNIEDLDKEKDALVQFMNTETEDYDKLTKSSVRVAEIIELLDNKMLRWLELDELA